MDGDSGPGDVTHAAEDDRRPRRRGAARPRAAADASLLLGLRPSGQRPRARAQQRHARSTASRPSPPAAAASASWRSSSACRAAGSAAPKRSTRLWTMVRFLLKADSYHGVWPHFLNGDTGKTIPFSRKDDGGDLVETSFLIAGLLCARQYFDGEDEAESRLRAAITWLWEEVEWSWHTQGGRNVLYWHWSPNNGWSMNHEIRGWNECLITYVLAASSPRYPIAPDVYHRGWADGRDFLNGRDLRRHHAAARPGRRRAAVPRALLLPRPRPARPQRPLRRLLAAERRAHADQPRALRAQSEGLQGLRPGLLGPDRERQHPRATTRTRRPTTSG